MAASLFTAATWPTKLKERLTTLPGSDLRQLEIQMNLLLTNLATWLASVGVGDSVITQAIPTIGTTVTVAIPAQTISVKGVPIIVAAETAKAFGALGTIPTAKWGLIVIERIADGTTSFVSAAANYTTGYASEALAIAAMPAKSTSKVPVGYLTILATTPGWVAGTDALAGGSGGTPATTTNYYGTPSIYDTTQWTVSQLANQAGTVLTSANY